jgi:ABC-type transport system involved in multi-copper enzyme maturation permease subunit
LFVGPVFTREAMTAPRRVRFHAMPAIGVGLLLCLLWTAWQILGDAQPGERSLDSPEVAARFGSSAFLLLAPLVMAVATLFSALVSAAAVAQEKDRKTLVLLLLTRMTNSELVLGRLLASLLEIVLAVAAVAPLFFLMMLFGGITSAQVLRVLAITLASALVAGSIGSTLAFWRETTFQSLAATTLAVLVWLALGEALAAGWLGSEVLGQSTAALATTISPWRAVVEAAQPQLPASFDAQANTTWLGQFSTGFLKFAALALLVVNGLAIALVRVWNPSRVARDQGPVDEAHSVFMSEIATGAPAADRRNVHRAPGKVREVWDNPVLWREMRTWAYGKKVVVIRVAYLAIAVACGVALYASLGQASTTTLSARVPAATGPLVPLAIVSLLLLNALAVTSLTTERDGRSLDLLLVTDLSPKEIVYGKLLGAIYNAKEMIAAPMALAIMLGVVGYSSVENVVLLVVTLLTFNAFAVMLGVHSGMHYSNSRQAVAASIGTLLFLFIGIAVCMRMMLALGSFDYQLGPFLGFIGGGGILLWVALGGRNPSRAISVVAVATPIATFYIITSFLQGDYGPATLVTLLAYGFATAAMLIPAIAEFDVTTGRTSDRAD